MTIFVLLAIALLASALFTITAKHPVYSVIGLLLNFLALAALYLSLSAEFLALIQILVYSGAILVLFVFVIALLSSGVKPFDSGPNKLPRIGMPAIVTALVAFGALVWGAVQVPFTPSVGPTQPNGPPGAADVFGSVADFGRALFGPYLLPFEMTALVLVIAIVGVIMLASDAAPAKTRGHHVKRPRRVREPITKTKAKVG
ncbi:MAG TPA: NADH-quinone oxidoreductase subunit J [Candidatus Acidoferrales bacterium]|nr:NADH-quinone oxidoreductase subunit J [Candidatus Acidoferrales bacterium]